MPRGYVLSEKDYLTLKADHYALKRALSNLRNDIGRRTRTSKPGRLPPNQVRFRNDNSGTAPAYGVLRITGGNMGANNGGGFLTIDQPNTIFCRLYLVNGSRDIGTGDYGWGSFLTAESINLERSQVLYDTGTPAIGDMWGAKASQWSLSVNRPGFYILGGIIRH